MGRAHPFPSTSRAVFRFGDWATATPNYFTLTDRQGSETTGFGFLGQLSTEDSHVN
jgi:hypothetical protein